MKKIKLGMAVIGAATWLALAPAASAADGTDDTWSRLGQNCQANSFLKRNASNTGWVCSHVTGESIVVGGAVVSSAVVVVAAGAQVVVSTAGIFGVAQVVHHFSGSSPVNLSIASLTDVIVASTTATLDGGRPVHVIFAGTALPVGAARTYTVKVKVDGVAQGLPFIQFAGAGDNNIITILLPVAVGFGSGQKVVSITFASSSASGVQTLLNGAVSVVEF